MSDFCNNFYTRCQNLNLRVKYRNCFLKKERFRKKLRSKSLTLTLFTHKKTSKFAFVLIFTKHKFKTNLLKKLGCEWEFFHRVRFFTIFLYIRSDSESNFLCPSISTCNIIPPHIPFTSFYAIPLWAFTATIIHINFEKAFTVQTDFSVLICTAKLSVSIQCVVPLFSLYALDLCEASPLKCD